MSSDRLKLFFILSFPPTNLNSLKRTCQGPVRNQAPTWQRIIYPKSERKVNGFEDIRMVLSPRSQVPPRVVTWRNDSVRPRSPLQNATLERSHPDGLPAWRSASLFARQAHRYNHQSRHRESSRGAPNHLQAGVKFEPTGSALYSYRHQGLELKSKHRAGGGRLSQVAGHGGLAAPDEPCQQRSVRRNPVLGVHHSIWRSLLHFWVACCL